MSKKIIIFGKEYDKDYIDRRGKEIAEKYKGKNYWKIADEEEFIWQEYGDTYIPEHGVIMTNNEASDE